MCELSISSRKFFNVYKLSIHGWLMDIGVLNVKVINGPSMSGGDGEK